MTKTPLFTTLVRAPLNIIPTYIVLILQVRDLTFSLAVQPT